MIDYQANSLNEEYFTLENAIKDISSENGRKIIESIDLSILLGFLEKMLLIRLFEDQVAKSATNKDFQTPVHLYTGQEAVAVGVCANLKHNDYCYSTHRCHGHFIAKGGNIKKLMAEIYGKASGLSSGHGGSMHITEPEIGFVGSSAIVGGTIPLAVGAALSAKFQNKNQVSVAFFGDGATDEGVFYECINIAKLYNLPIIFVCENNFFSTHMPDFLRQSNPMVHERIKGFNLPTLRVNGTNVAEVYQESKKMISNARKGNGPALIECMVYRWLAHVGPTPDIDIGYRVRKDVEYWKNKCPIDLLKQYLISKGAIDDASYGNMEADAKKKVNSALQFAVTSAYPELNTINKGLF